MSETRARRSRSGGGAARRAERTAVSVETERYIERNIPLYEFLDEATLEIIEYNAETCTRGNRRELRGQPGSLRTLALGWGEY